MAADTVTHKDLSTLLGVSETTVKSYRRKFGEFIPLYSRGKPLRFKRAAVDVCRTIRDGFQNNLSVDEIRDTLHATFPVVEEDSGLKQHVSVSDDTEGAAGDRAAGPDGIMGPLLHQMERLTAVQEQVVQRLDGLYELLADSASQQAERDLATAERFSELKEAWAEQLLGLRRVMAARRRPEQPQVEPAEKRITVRNVYGDETQYVMRSEAAFQTGRNTHVSQGAEGGEPAQEFLSLPLVIESGTEYLGVAGKSEGPFSMSDFKDLLNKYAKPSKQFAIRWERRGDAWRLEAEQSQAVKFRSFALEAQRTTTPRGNAVALLQSVEKDGMSVPPANLYAYIKELREGAA